MILDPYANFQDSEESNDQNEYGDKHGYRQSDRDSDPDFDDGDMAVYSISHGRGRRIQRTVTRGDEVNLEDFLEFAEDDRPRIAQIIGYHPKDDKYFVRYHNSSAADAEYLTLAQLLSQPSGASHATSWRNAKNTHGLIQSPDIPFLQIPENYVINDRQIDRVVWFNPETELYLVKWKGREYHEVSWTVNIDPASIQRFEQITHYVRPRYNAHPVMLPYGEDNPVPPYKNGNTLRDYQVDALNWMRAGYCANKNLILADEMGLGKTIMCMSMLLEIVNHIGIPGPFLVIAPLSTLPNWQREFEMWTDFNVICLHGNEVTRNIIKQYELNYPPPHEHHHRFNVILTNMETIGSEVAFIGSVTWHYVIIDEAHRLKNMSSKFYRLLAPMNMEHILLMTGTPIQNNLDEIFSLMHFIDPQTFNNLDAFKIKYHNCETAADVQNLQAAIQPYMLRRKKNDVETSIGVKEETIVMVELTQSQKLYYRLLIDGEGKALASKVGSVRLPALQNLHMQLRKVCNHPFLIPEAITEFVKEDKDYFEQVVKASGKVFFTDKLLTKLKPTGSKVLIFSQMVKMLDILEDFLKYRQHTYVRLDGNKTGAVRQMAIDKFNDPSSDVFVFLLCTRAGGVGLNLTAANNVIIYDSDWNPQNDIQAQARCHRIGQSKDVMVYRLITRNTYESELFERASMKLGLDQAILDSAGKSDNQLSSSQIEMLLKQGAYHALFDDDSETRKFESEDIEEILQHRTRTRQMVGSGSFFKKASFVINNDGEAIDINDKDFWQRILPALKLAPGIDSANHRGLSYRSNSFGDNDDFTYMIDDFDDHNGFKWTETKRDQCFNCFLRFGWGRWTNIQVACQRKSPPSIEETCDACHVFLHVITQACQNPEILLSELEDTQLSSKQRRMITNDPFSRRDWTASVQSKAAVYAERLLSLHALHAWANNEEPLGPRYKKLRHIWSSDVDIRLLRMTSTFGYGYPKEGLDSEVIWHGCQEHEQVKQKHRSTVQRRIDQLLDIIRQPDEVGVPECPLLAKLKPGDIDRLLTAISGSGSDWSLATTIFPMESMEQIGPIVLNTARLIAYLPLHMSTREQKNEVEKYCPEATNLLPSLSTQIANRIRRNTDWLARLRQMGRRTPLFGMKYHPPIDPCEWWVTGKSEAQLIKHVIVSGFTAVSTFVAEKAGSNDPHYRVFDDDDFVIQYISQVIEANGGWKVPPVMDLPETYVNDLPLPYSEGDIQVTSLGQGETFLCEGYLYRAGFRAKSSIMGRDYTCSIDGRNCFIIARDGFKVSGDTIAGAFDKIGEEVAGLMIEEFGLGSHVVQHEFMRTAAALPQGYIVPDYVTFVQKHPDAERIRLKPEFVLRKDETPVNSASSFSGEDDGSD